MLCRCRTGALIAKRWAAGSAPSSREKMLGRPLSSAMEDAAEPAVPQIRAWTRSLEQQGSRYARKSRQAGRCPGVVYAVGDGGGGGGVRGAGDGGDSERLLVETEGLAVAREMRRHSFAFENTVYDLVLQDEAERAPIRVLPSQPVLHPIRGHPLNVNFIRYRAGRRQAVPVRFVNDDLCEAIRLRRKVDLELPTDPADLPQFLDIDVSDVNAGVKLRVKDLVMPPGLRLHKNSDPDMLLATVKGKKWVVTEEGSDEEGLL